MAKLHGCRMCRIEMERIELANGPAMLFCAVCDTLGDEAHSRREPAGMTRKPLKLVVNRPKTVIVKKFSYAGKKSQISA